MHLHLFQNHHRQPVYHSQEIQAWEKRWFAANNSSYGLMQQAAFAMALQIKQVLQQKSLSNKNILVWCGQGNNGGDGYLIAKYLKQFGFSVMVYAAKFPLSADAIRARHEVEKVAFLPIIEQNDIQARGDINAEVHIDAIFGIGLNRPLENDEEELISDFNIESGFKIAIDIPSGLDPNGSDIKYFYEPYPSYTIVQADLTLSVMGLKLGLLIGAAKNHVGQIIEIPLIPKDDELKPSAYINYTKPVLPLRRPLQNKSDFGHVLVVGGHENMGGAVIMSGEAAFYAGAGKVTIACHAKHHQAILARSPNIMLQDIDALNQDDILQLLSRIDTVCFGMGLGRDEWAEQTFKKWFDILKQISEEQQIYVVLDADALWFLAQYPTQLNDYMYATPHSGEANRLLDDLVHVDKDRIAAIQQLQQKYSGSWVLKGAGTLTLECGNLDICAFGNAGMGTAGMGDVLSGMIAGIVAQFIAGFVDEQVTLADIVALHALAGDELAKHGMRGIQAHQMMDAIYKVVNLASA